LTTVGVADGTDVEVDVEVLAGAGAVVGGAATVVPGASVPAGPDVAGGSAVE
jgi:hypothetical protein